MDADAPAAAISSEIIECAALLAAAAAAAASDGPQLMWPLMLRTESERGLDLHAG
jgi:hypothetical protein